MLRELHRKSPKIFNDGSFQPQAGNQQSQQSSVGQQ